MIMAMTKDSSWKSEIMGPDALVYFETAWHDYIEQGMTKMPVVLTSCGPEVPGKCSLHVSPHCSTLADFLSLAHDCRTARPAEIRAGPWRRIYSTSGGGWKIEKSAQWIFLAIGWQRSEAMSTEQASICWIAADAIQDCIDLRRPVRSWPSLDETCWQLPRLHDQAWPWQARPWPGMASTAQAWPRQAWPARPGLHDVQHRLPPAFMTVSPAKAKHPEDWKADSYPDTKLMEVEETEAWEDLFATKNFIILYLVMKTFSCAFND